MTYEGPKTVTFNAPPESEARYRSARLGSRVIAYTLGVAAAILAVVALLWSLGFALALAVTWGEAVKLALIAFGVTGALVGLPIASALLTRSYPKESRLSMTFWMGMLAVAAIAMLFFVYQLEPPANPKARQAEFAQTRRLAISDAESRVPEDVWYYSDGCRSPANDYELRHCRRVIDAREASAPWDLSPRALLPISDDMADGRLRRILVLLLGFLAIAGAGFLGRLAVLATAESYRLGEGTAGLEPLPANTATLPDLSATAALTPADAFSMWANGRLIPSPDDSVTGNDAYADYQETCKINHVAPMSAGKFGTMMTAKAATTDGSVIKTKTGGKHVYRGWKLAGELEEIGADDL